MAPQGWVRERDAEPRQHTMEAAQARFDFCKTLVRLCDAISATALALQQPTTNAVIRTLTVDLMHRIASDPID
jgi:hypothetical protein